MALLIAKFATVVSSGAYVVSTKTQSMVAYHPNEGSLVPAAGLVEGDEYDPNFDRTLQQAYLIADRWREYVVAYMDAVAAGLPRGNNLRGSFLRRPRAVYGDYTGSYFGEESFYLRDFLNNLFGVGNSVIPYSPGASDSAGYRTGDLPMVEEHEIVKTPGVKIEEVSEHPVAEELLAITDSKPGVVTSVLSEVVDTPSHSAGESGTGGPLAPTESHSADKAHSGGGTGKPKRNRRKRGGNRGK